MDAQFPPPCRPPAWRECLNTGRSTVVGVSCVEDVEIGVVDGGRETLHAHLVAVTLQTLAVEGSLGDIKEGVDQRPLTRVLAAQDDNGTVFELFLRTRLVEELRPH